MRELLLLGVERGEGRERAVRSRPLLVVNLAVQQAFALYSRLVAVALRSSSSALHFSSQALLYLQLRCPRFSLAASSAACTSSANAIIPCLSSGVLPSSFGPSRPPVLAPPRPPRPLPLPRPLGVPLELMSELETGALDAKRWDGSGRYRSPAGSGGRPRRRRREGSRAEEGRAVRRVRVVWRAGEASSALRAGDVALYMNHSIGKRTQTPRTARELTDRLQLEPSQRFDIISLQRIFPQRRIGLCWPVQIFQSFPWSLVVLWLVGCLFSLDQLEPAAGE